MYTSAALLAHLHRTTTATATHHSTITYRTADTTWDGNGGWCCGGHAATPTTTTPPAPLLFTSVRGGVGRAVMSGWVHPSHLT